MNFGFLYLIFNTPKGQALALLHDRASFAYGHIFSWNKATDFFFPLNIKIVIWRIGESLGNLKEWVIGSFRKL